MITLSYFTVPRANECAALRGSETSSTHRTWRGRVSVANCMQFSSSTCSFPSCTRIYWITLKREISSGQYFCLHPPRHTSLAISGSREARTASTSSHQVPGLPHRPADATDSGWVSDRMVTVVSLARRIAHTDSIGRQWQKSTQNTTTALHLSAPYANVQQLSACASAVSACG